MTTLVEKRLCKDCGEYKQVEEEIRPLGRFCFACHRKKRNEYYRVYHQKHKERERKAREERMRTDEEFRERQDVYRKAWLERLRANPEKHAAYRKRQAARLREKLKNPENRLRENENQRISRRKKWEEQGRVLEPVSMETYRKYNKTPRIEYPIAPLLPFLEQWLTEHSQASLSRNSGVPERRIYDYMHIQKNASMISIEKLCHAMGITLDLVYDQSDDLEEISDDGDLCA